MAENPLRYASFSERVKEVIEKFRAQTAQVLSEERAREIIALTERFEELDDVRPLVRLVA